VNRGQRGGGLRDAQVPPKTYGDGVAVAVGVAVEVGVAVGVVVSSRVVRGWGACSAVVVGSVLVVRSFCEGGEEGVGVVSGE
jgi:hypothetical protein